MLLDIIRIEERNKSIRLPEVAAGKTETRIEHIISREHNLYDPDG